MKKLLPVVIAAAIVAAAAGYYLLRDRRPNVVYIVIDTLRADHVSSYGYERNTTPEIDKFAAENLKFNYAVTAAPWTPASMASMFTSLYASAHGMMPPNSRLHAERSSTRLSDDFLTIAEVFHMNGFQTAGVTSNPWLQKSFGYSQGFEKYVYLHRVRSNEVNAAAYKIIDQLKTGRKPFFLYIHYMDPHNPYDPLPEYRNRFTAPLQKRAYPENVQHKIDLYDGEIAFNDLQFGLLIQHLRNKGLYDNTAVVLVADHGEQFKERGSQGHGFNLNNEELHVPLLIKTPQGGKKGEVNELVSLIDLYPTMLEMAGLKPPLPIEGFSVLSQLPERQRAGAAFEIRRVTNFKGHLDSSFKKLINSYPPEQELVIELDTKPLSSQVFDSQNDYFELSPLSDPELEQKLGAEFNENYERILKFKHKDTAGEVRIDDKTLEELKTLGYL